MLGARPLDRPAIMKGRSSQSVGGAIACPAGCERDDDVARVDGLAAGARHTAGVEQSEQQVEDVGMRFLQFVDEQDASRSLERHEERRRLRVAAVPGR